MLLAQATQPAVDSSPGWVVMALAIIAGVAAILAAIRLTLVPQIRDLFKQGAEALAEAKAASAKSDATQQSLNRVASGLHSAQQSITAVAAAQTPADKPPVVTTTNYPPQVPR